MIRVVVDGKVIEVVNAAALKDRVEEIFKDDPRSNVLVTYTVTEQPASRRMA